MFDLLDRWKAGHHFGPLRDRFAADPSTPAPVRGWLAETAAGRPPRTLVLVCHGVQTARRQGSRFLLLDQGHTLAADFTRPRWDAHAATVERVLGLPAGAAGRDAP
jgi:hypothetical protein